MGVAVREFCGLQVRHPHGLHPGDFRGTAFLGTNRRPVAAAGMLSFLAADGVSFRFSADSLEKIFEICKNIVCICEKMGYNKVYDIFQKNQERR